MGKRIKKAALVIGSGIGGILLFTLAVTLYLYLSGNLRESEETIRYYDSKEHDAFVDMLKGEEIPFRIGQGGGIFYPVSYRDRVEGVSKELRNNFGPKFSYITVQPDQLGAAKQDFEGNGIVFDVLRFEDRYMIQWKRENNTKVMKMLQSASYHNSNLQSDQ